MIIEYETKRSWTSVICDRCGRPCSQMNDVFEARHSAADHGWLRHPVYNGKDPRIIVDFLDICPECQKAMDNE